jgi:S1-C subfamily serine protease
MVIPSFATAKGWPARMARSSTIVAAIERWAPRQPERFAAWGREISNAPYPSALGLLKSPPNPGPPPGTSITPAVDQRVRASTMLVTGRACNEIQEGSGWLAAPGVVVTNAHVVAGERTTTVAAPSGASMPATVIAFDPVRDVAVLAVPELATTKPAPRPLTMATGSHGTVGAVYGHPGGGLLKASPARVGEEILAVGTDIYRTGTSRRHVYVLAAALAPGDSGGAVVDSRGRIIGMAFAIDPGRTSTAYAVTDEEIRPVLRNVLQSDQRPVSTGRCLLG